MCYDDPQNVPVIKAATQAKRKAGLGPADIFSVNSTRPIPSGAQYQSFIRVPGNRDKVASHLLAHIFNRRRSSFLFGNANVMSIGVTPLDSAGQDDRGNVPAEPTTLATAEGSVGEGPSPGVTSANDGMGGEGATPSSDGREEVFATGDGVTARAQPAIGPLPVLLRRKGEDEPVKELGPVIGEGAKYHTRHYLALELHLEGGRPLVGGDICGY